MWIQLLVPVGAFRADAVLEVTPERGEELVQAGQAIPCPSPWRSAVLPRREQAVTR